MALPAHFVNANAVTPHDTNANVFKSLYIGGTGNVVVRTKGGQQTTFNGVPAGGYLWIEVDRVLSTGTTATNIVGLT